MFVADRAIVAVEETTNSLRAFEAMWKNSTFDAIRHASQCESATDSMPENGARYPGGLGQGLLQMRS
jgi:hypothetical protein